MRVLKNKSLKELTTFRIGGKAEFFIDAKTCDAVSEAVKWANDRNLQISILGGGSNILVPDEGVRGLVLKVSIPGINVVEEDDSRAAVRVGAGVNWDEFVNWSVENNLWGIENLSFIPGNVGASPVQNIGAYGMEAKDTIRSVAVFDMESKSLEEMNNADCDFGYRTSIFKQTPGRYVVTSVVFELQKNGRPNLSYPDLKKIDGKKLNLKKIRQTVISIRQSKLPDIDKIGTAGSFFKNPEVSQAKMEEIRSKHPELPVFPVPGGEYKISLGWIIDHVCKMKGYTEGDVGTYSNQALALVNHGKGTSEDIEKLAEIIEEKVKSAIGIEIDWEVVKFGKI